MVNVHNLHKNLEKEPREPRFFGRAIVLTLGIFAVLGIITSVDSNPVEKCSENEVSVSPVNMLPVTRNNINGFAKQLESNPEALVQVAITSGDPYLYPLVTTGPSDAMDKTPREWRDFVCRDRTNNKVMLTNEGQNLYFETADWLRTPGNIDPNIDLHTRFGLKD